MHGQPRLTAGDVVKMWNSIKPVVRNELLHDADKERACGHTCHTCPTRKTCHLHAAVDIEDMY